MNGGMGSFGVGDILARIGLTGDDAFKRQLDGVDARVNKSAQTMNKVLNVAILAGAAAFVVSVAAAAKFETAMRNVNSISKLSEEQFRAQSKQVIDLSKTLPQSAKTLAEGLYDIASSGFQGAEGMTVLGAAAKAASAGMTTTAVSAKGITAVLNAYGLEAESAAEISDIMFKTVDKGVITFEQLSSTVGDWIGMGKAAGLEFNELSGAIAYMTTKGIGASEAGTSLQRLLIGFVKPSEEMAIAIRNAGFESGEMMLKQKGLAGAMEILNTATGGTLTSLLKLMPEIRGVRGATALLGAGYEELTTFMGDFNNTAGATDIALAEQSKAFSFQASLLKNQVTAAFIEFGNKVLPVLNDIFKALNKHPAIIGTIASTILPFITVAGGLSLALKGLNLTLGLFGKSISLLTAGPLIGIAAALAGLAVLVGRNMDAAKKADLLRLEEIKNRGKELVQLESLIPEYLKLKNQKSLNADETKRLNDLEEQIEGRLKRTGQSVRDLTDDWRKQYDIHKELERLDIQKKLRETQDRIEALTSKSELWKVTLKALISGNADFGTQLFKSSEELIYMYQKSNNLNKSLEDLDNPLKNVIDATKLYSLAGIAATDTIKQKIDKLIILSGTYKDNEKATALLEAEVKRLKKEMGGSGGLIDVTKLCADAGIKLTDSVRSEINSYEKLLPLIRDDAYATEQLKDKIHELKLKIGDAAYLNKLADGLQVNAENMDTLKIRTKEFTPEIVDLKEGTDDLSESVKKSNEDWLKNATLIGDITGKLLGLGDVTSKTTQLIATLATGGLGPVGIALAVVDYAIDVLPKLNDALAITGDLGTSSAIGIARWTQYIQIANDLTEEQIRAMEEAGLSLALYNAGWIDLNHNIIKGSDAIDKSNEMLKETSAAIYGTMQPLSQLRTEFENFDRMELEGTIALLEQQILNLKYGTDEYYEMEQAIQDAKAQLAVLNGTIDEQSEALGTLEIAWETMFKTMFQEFSAFEEDLKMATKGIEDLLYFKIDLDATDVDEQINAAIVRMTEYLNTLDPASPAYADAKKALDDLIALYERLGKDVDFTVTAHYEETGTYTGPPDKTTVHHGGILTAHKGNILEAHSGTYLGRREVPFIGLEDESVLNSAATAKLGPANVMAFNASLDERYLSKDREEVPIVVEMHGVVEGAWAEIYKKSLNPQRKKIVRYQEVAGSPF